MVSSFGKCMRIVVATVGLGQMVSASMAPKVNNLEKGAHFTRKDCKMLIAQKEKQHGIPVGLLAAIASIESEFNPYAVNSNGQSRSFKNINDAKLYVTSLREQGVIDINIGALQINYGFHMRKFKNAVAILNPYENIGYAAKYLASLKSQYGSWVRAVKFYHSPDSKYQDIYMTKVMNSLKRINYTTYCDLSGTTKKSVNLKPARANANSR